MSEKLVLCASKSYEALKKFVEGGDLKIAVSEIIGDIHMESAKLSLEMSGVSRVPTDRIKSAITHLEAAHVSYRKIWKNENPVTVGFNMGECQYASVKDVFVSSLMACCYTYLGDYAPAQKSLDFASEAYAGRYLDFNLTNFLGLSVGFATALPNIVGSLRKIDKADNLLKSMGLEDSEFQEFHRLIKRLHY